MKPQDSEKKARKHQAPWPYRLLKTHTWQTILGAVVGAAATVLLTSYFGPHSPDPAPLAKLVRSEAELVMAEPRDLKEREYGDLFLEDAWIVDVAAQRFWRGKTQILDRFRSLERFKALEHVISEAPEFDGESSAIVHSTSKVAPIDPATGAERSYTGTERWTFHRIGDRWRISRFEYNLP